MPWSREDLTRLVELEAHQQGVDPRLAVSLAEQESGFNPTIRSPKGAYGVFQLMPGTAKQLKVNIDDPADNIRGGITYLRQQLDAFGGDPAKAVAAYNAGPGVVQAYKGVPPYKETRGLVSRVLGALSPASAEASTAPATTGGSRLQELEAELARRDAQQPPQDTTPSPPTATSTPEQDAAYRASRGQQAPATAPQTAPAPTTQPEASQAPPAPSPDPSATPGMRFQALPSITQLEPADRIQKTKLFESLKPPQQEEFLRSEEPTADITVDIEKPSPAAPRPMSDAYRMGPGGHVQIAPIQSSASEADLSGANRPHDQGIPLSAVPAIAVNTIGTVGGAALGAPLGPVGSAAGAALGGSLATRANTALGLASQEKPLLETPWANVYPSDLLGAIPFGVATGTAAGKGTVRNLPGANVAKHEIAAERLGELAQRTGPAVPSDVLWQKAGQSNTAIATADVWRTAGDVVRRKSRTPNLSADDPALKAAQDLLALAKKHGGPVPIQDLDDARRNLVPHLRDPDVKRLYGSIIDDMDNAVSRGVPGAADLRGAIAATRKEHALAELTDLWSDGKGMQKTSGDVTQVYGKRIRNQFEQRMQKDKTFAGAFTPEELTDIRLTLRDVGKLTKITNPEAQGTVGSTLKWLGRLGGAGYGATSGDLLTGGMMILATEGASAVMANAMQSKIGRVALREAIREGNGNLTHGSLAAIAALVAREAAPDAPAQPQTP